MCRVLDLIYGATQTLHALHIPATSWLKVCHPTETENVWVGPETNIMRPFHAVRCHPIQSLIVIDTGLCCSAADWNEWMEIGDGPPGASVADALQENTIEQRFQYALAKKKTYILLGHAVYLYQIGFIGALRHYLSFKI